MTDNDKFIYEMAIEKYGKLQLVIAIEEMAELQKEISKAMRNQEENKTVHQFNLCEEIADVEIMLQQLRLYFDLGEDLISEYKENKKKALFKRLEDYINNKIMEESNNE